MHWLCKIGWHKWKFTEVRRYSPEATEVYARCERPGCTRYPHDFLVNVDNVRKPW